MATLEKIRKRSVLLIVIIGAALLAFILGDAINNGRTLFGGGTTVAKLGDAKVDISEYQQRLEMLQSANPDADGQELSQYVISNLIEEKLIDNAADKMGIEVGDEMVTFFIMNQPLEPIRRFVSSYASYLQQIYPNVSQENIQNPRFWHSLIFSPEKYGVSQDAVEPLKQNWLAMEKETKDAARRAMYTNLLGGLIQPSALDKKDLFENNYASTTIDYTVKRFDDLSKYKVSDAELKAEYEKRKNYYKVNEDTKTVGFIAYHVTPSDADKKNAEKLQAQALEQLRKGDNIDKTLVKAGVNSAKGQYSASALNNLAMTQFLQGDSVASAKVGDVKAFPTADGSFQIIKVLGIGNMANDGAEIQAIQVLKDAEADLRAAIAAGVPLDSITERIGADKVQVDQVQNFALQNPEVRRQLPVQLAAQLDTVSAGALLDVQSTDEGSLLAYVKSVQAPVPVYDLALVSYTLYPSKETVEAASEALAKYAAANNTPEKFGANAQKAGYIYQSMPVTGSSVGFRTDPVDAQLGNYYPMASRLISWAITDGEPGNISEVVSNDNSQNPYIYIAMVENEYDDFAPYNDSNVKKQLENIIRRNKAGDEMVKLYSGKGDLNATAEAMKTPVFTDQVVRFKPSAQFSDAKVLGRIVGSKPGSKVYVVKGDDGVYAYVVKSKNEPDTKMNNDEVKANYFGVFAGSRNNISNMLRGNKRLENKLYKMTGSR